ncbi:hypothetical protein B1R94_02325 [Mycolicibacterium litorale]|nr:hypothetical protein B1R94_02325 [Mycolicibacterium litorale]
MSVAPVVKGYKLRATKTDRCGLPLEGPKNRFVTDCFVSVKTTPVMKDRQELEQPNAEGRVIFSDTTPPSRKHHNAEIVMAGIDPEQWALFLNYPTILDHNGNVIGFGDKKDVDSKTGLAIEVWTGGSTDDDCGIPDDDTIFSLPDSGLTYGYLLMCVTEFTPPPISIEAAISTFTMTGITTPMSRWGRGPYNVARIDNSGTAGRLLVPIEKDRHLTWFRTPVDPPETTDGAVSLGIQSLFTVDPYFGSGAADVAPDQDDSLEATITVTGSPTGGNFTVKFANWDSSLSATIAYNSTNSAAKTAISGVDDGHLAAEFTVTGGALPGTALVVKYPAVLGAMSIGTKALIGGTAPDVAIS